MGRDNDSGSIFRPGTIWKGKRTGCKTGWKEKCWYMAQYRVKPTSWMYGKNPHPVGGFVEADQGSVLDMCPASTEHWDHNFGQRCRINILRANLKNAWSIGTGGGQDSPKIQVVREHHGPMSLCITHDGLIRSCRVSYTGPMHSFKSCILQDRYPIGRQIHVDQDSHATDGFKGTSTSSTRHAA